MQKEVQTIGRLVDYWNCAIQIGLLGAEIAQCTISDGKSCRPKDCIAQFSGPVDATSQNCTKQVWRTLSGKICEFSGRKAEPSLLEMRNVVWERQSLGQGFLDPSMSD